MARLLGSIEGVFQIRLPGRSIVVPWDASLPAQLAYYLAVGDYEHHDLDLAEEFVKPGDVAMELGGGVGVTGCALGLASGNPVVVVEPNPALAGPIRRTFAANGVGLTLVQAAATGGAAGPSRLAVADNYWWSSIEERPGLPVVEVASVPFADLVQAHRPTVVAIDIEGHERALAGSPIAACVRLVLFEIHTPDLGTKETARIVSWLQAEGFSMLDVRANSWVFGRPS